MRVVESLTFNHPFSYAPDALKLNHLLFTYNAIHTTNHSTTTFAMAFLITPFPIAGA